MLSAPLSSHKISPTFLELQARTNFVFGHQTTRRKCSELSWCRGVNMILLKLIALSSCLMERALFQDGQMVRSGHFYHRVENFSGSSTMPIKKEAKILVALWQLLFLQIAIMLFQAEMTVKSEFGTSVNKPRSFSLLRRSTRHQLRKYYILKRTMALL